MLTHKVSCLFFVKLVLLQLEFAVWEKVGLLIVLRRKGLQDRCALGSA